MNHLKFGYYIQKDSIIHKLHPIIKLALLTLFILLSANINSTTDIFIMLIILIIIIKIAKLSIKSAIYSLKPFRFLIILTLAIQLLFIDNGTFDISISYNKIYNTVLFSLRFIFILIFSSLYTMTTTIIDIAKSIFIFTKPLKYLKFNLKEIAISILIAIRFIPLLFEEADKIITAQKLRGIWKDNFKSKYLFFLKSETFIIPLFMRVIHYAEQLSITLNYRDNIEEIMRLSKPSNSDLKVVIITISLYLLITTTRHYYGTIL